ncbi:Envelope fusion protein, partial [Aphis craccivora]
TIYLLELQNLWLFQYNIIQFLITDLTTFSQNPSYGLPGKFLLINYFICYAIQPVRKEKTPECVYSIYCKYLYFELNGSIFHKLEFKNAWIYTADKKLDSVIIDEKSESIKLIGTGLLINNVKTVKGMLVKNILHPVGGYNYN